MSQDAVVKKGDVQSYATDAIEMEDTDLATKSIIRSAIAIMGKSKGMYCSIVQSLLIPYSHFCNPTHDLWKSSFDTKAEQNISW